MKLQSESTKMAKCLAAKLLIVRGIAAWNKNQIKESNQYYQAAEACLNEVLR